MSKATPVWRMDPRPYAAMRRRHKALWEFLPRFIRAFGVRSIVEIGCGPAELAPLVPRYLGIDINSNIAAWAQERGRNVVAGDWLTMQIGHLEGSQPDLALSCATVEHCAHYAPFLDRMLALQPRLLLVTFFFNVAEAEDRIVPREENGVRYYENRYSLTRIMEYLATKGLADYRHNALVDLPSANRTPNHRDSVLLLSPGGDGERLRAVAVRLAHDVIGGTDYGIK